MDICCSVFGWYIFSKTFAIASGTDLISSPSFHAGTSVMPFNCSIESLGSTPERRVKETILDNASAIAESFPPALPRAAKSSKGFPSSDILTVT